MPRPSPERPVPLHVRGQPDPDLTLADIDSSLTLQEAADASGFHVNTLRGAIRRGELDVWVPRGREPGRTGSGNHGYRVTLRELERWIFNKPKGGQP